MIQPIHDADGVQRLASAMSALQTAYAALPMDYDGPGVWRMWYTAISYRWDGIRAAFGSGDTPAGVTIAGDGLPDNDGLKVLIARSKELTAKQRFAMDSLLHHVPLVNRATVEKMHGFAFNREPWLKAVEAILLFTG